MVKVLLFRLQVTNSKLKNKKIHFEILTQWLNFYFFHLRVTNSKLKSIKLHLKLLTRKLEKNKMLISYHKHSRFLYWNNSEYLKRI